MTEATADRVRANCDHCNALFNVPATAVGRKAKCPKCGEKFIVRGPAKPQPQPKPQKAAAAKPTEEKFRFDCSGCGATLKVPKSAIGRKVKCRQCQGVVTVPDPDAPAADDGGWLDDDMLAGLEGGAALDPSAAPTSSGPITSRCPNCGGGMTAGAVLCTSCGFNLKTGKAVKLASTKERAPAAPRQRASGGGGGSGIGRLLLGGLLSAAFTGLGFVVWFLANLLIPVVGGPTVTIIGLMAGLGMRLVVHDKSILGGLLATFNTLLCIGVIKAVLFFFVVFVSVASQLPFELADSPRDKLVYCYVIEEIDEAEDAGRDYDEDALYEAAGARVAALSDDEVEREVEEFGERFGEASASDAAAMTFSVFDILFIPAALGIAFVVGGRLND